jgi:hypothetical protein
MTQHDEYDIIQDTSAPPQRTLSTMTWISLIVAAALIAFSIGLAVGTLRSRTGRVASVAPPTPEATAIAIVGLPTDVVTATIATVAATASPTPTLTLTPTPSPTVACTLPVDGQFATGYDPAELGCATAQAAIYWAAWEPFERGAMFWRSDTNQAYALFHDGVWTPVDQGWDGQEIPSRGDPPPGLRAPIRGFGYAWALRDDLFNRLGWATSEEKGFCATIQPFERGFMMVSSTVEYCQDNLYNTAREPGWTPLQLVVRNEGLWRNLAQPAVITVPDAQVSRPAANGWVVATSLTPQLDADFAEWPLTWSTISAVVQGAEYYAGARDLSGAFQVAWSNEGLYLALRVVDDRHQSGPPGTDLWQGDGLELHLDRQLQADFANLLADDDDYQIGVSFGPQRNQLVGYRWLPLAKEGAFTPGGTVRAGDRGYDAELFFPWSLFEVTSSDLAPRLFGFLLSLNDNDQDAPAQQTVLSTSARRTTYNRPDEWGTLILALD